MAFEVRISLRQAAASMVAASMLAACTVNCRDSDIAKAVSYSNEPFVFGTYAQENRWIENARLSLFLQQSIQSSGIVKVARRHDLQCVARRTPENCTDCYVCTGTIAAEVIALRDSFPGVFYCGSDGTVAIRAEIGPGATTTSMTYWTPRERPKAVD